MDDNTKINVVNRSKSVVIYYVPDMNNLRREFQSRETKTVPFEELRRLSYLPGGRVILNDYLIIRNEEALKELGLEVEPEYFYEEKDVKRLLTDGSLNEFLDCLDFAPDGVIDLVKQLAVDLPLNDVSKREALKDKLDYDVNKVIELRRMTEEKEQQEAEKQKATRRAAAPVKEGNVQVKPVRRVVKE